jgi:hypothetical protein
LSNTDIEKGLEAPYLREKQTKPILLGGNQTIQNPAPIRLTKMGMLLRKHTGEKGYDSIDSVYGINNFQSIASAKEIFNGNSTELYYWNPWGEKIGMEGSEYICPEHIKYDKEDLNLLKKNKSKVTLNNLENDFRNKKSFEISLNAQEQNQEQFISIYNYRFNRTLSFENPKSRQDESNLKFKKYFVSQRNYKNNQPKYFQKDLYGYLNVTSVLDAPFLISQNHLFNVDDRVYQKFVYYDKENKLIYPTEKDDLGFYETEENSGLVTSMKMSYHYNLQIKPSLLFIGCEEELEGISIQNENYIIAPLFNLEYSKKIDPKHFEYIFEGLFDRDRLMSNYYPIVFPVFFVSLIFLILIAYMFIKQRQKDFVKEEDEGESFEDRLIGHENEHMDV